MRLVLLLLAALAAHAQQPQYVISTLSGRTLPPVSVAATSIPLRALSHIVSDRNGGLYISTDSCIHHLDAQGQLTRAVGTGQKGFSGDNGPAVAAQVWWPMGMAVDPPGNLYFADYGSSRIRKVGTNGIVTTVAGGGGSSADGIAAAGASLSDPRDVTVDGAGNLYILDYPKVRKVATNGTISTIITTVPDPESIAADDAGNLYVANSTSQVFKYSAGVLAPFVSANGPAISLAIGGSGNLLISVQDHIYRASSGGALTLIAGDGSWEDPLDGALALSSSAQNSAVAADSAGNVYFVAWTTVVRKISTAGIVSTAAGGATPNGVPAPLWRFNVLGGLAVDASGNRYTAGDNRVYRIGANGMVTTVAGMGPQGYSGDGGLAVNALLFGPNSVALDGAGNLYIGDTGNSRIRKVTPGGIITTVVDNIGFWCMTADAAGNLYFSGPSYFVQKVNTNGIISTIAGTGVSGYSGDGGPAVNAKVSAVTKLTVDASGNVFLADNLRVRKISTGGIISTVAGTGADGVRTNGVAATSSVVRPYTLAVDTAGNLFLDDEGAIRMVTAGGTIWTLSQAGQELGPDGELAANQQSGGGWGIAVDSGGRVYFALQSIRVMTPVGQQPVLLVASSHAGNFQAGQSGTYSLTVRNAASAGASSGTVTATEYLRNATVTSMSGNGWSCSVPTCTRGDSLAPGASYPPITVAVSVPLTSNTQITNQVTVSGGGAEMYGADDFTLAIPPTPVLSIAKTHSTQFARGLTGHYSVSVSNTSTVATNGAVTVTDTPPTGMTIAMSGSGWTCGPGGNTCTRSDALAGGATYPSIDVRATIDLNAAASLTNVVTVSGGGSASASASDVTSIAAACTYAFLYVGVTVGPGASTGSVGVTASYCPVTPTSNASWVTVTGSGGSAVYSVAANPNGTPRRAAITVGAAVLTITQVAASVPAALRFVPVTPCRIADTRGAAGASGGPALGAGATRDFDPVASACGIPASAMAYSLNLTVVPSGPLGFLSVWPAGQSQPTVSTLNSPDGRIKANAAIVPAGLNGAVTLLATQATHAIVDINGYFVPAIGNANLAYYPVTPCRLADTRIGAGTFGGPTLAPATTRTFPVAGSCGVPANAQAYVLNATVVPPAALGFLSVWPAGQGQPSSSTLNAPTGTVTSNMAIVPAGANGAVTVIATNATELIVDVSGYFAPPGAGGLDYYVAAPCRVLDTRGTQGPALAPSQARTVDVPGSGCGVPPTARAYSINATVVPPGALGFLSLWGSGAQPTVSTLNAPDGTVASNAAILLAGTGGVVTAFTSHASHLILDLNGYFQ